MKLNFMKPRVSPVLPEERPVVESEPVAELAAVRSEKPEKRGAGSSVYDTIVRVVLIAAAALVPLFYLPWTSGVLDYNKQALLLVLVSVGLVSWLLGVVIRGTLTVRSSPLDKGVLAFLGAMIVATIFSLTPAKSLFGFSASVSSSLLSFIALALFYFLAVNTLHDGGRMLRTALLVSGVVALIAGVCQMFGWYILPGSFTHARGFTPLGSLNVVGVFAAILLPLFARTGMRAAGRVIGSLAILGIALSILVLGILNWWVLWTVALVGMLATIAFDSLNAAQLAQDYGGRKRRFVLSRFIVPVIVLVVGAFLLLVRFSVPQLKSAFPVEVAPSYQLSFGIATSVIKERLIFGWGPENFSLTFDRFGAGKIASSELSSIRFFDATSELFNVIVHGGLLAVLALGVMIWGLFQLLRQFGGMLSVATARSGATEATGVFASLIAAIAAFLLYPFPLPLWMVTVALLVLAGLAVSGTKSTSFDIEDRPIVSLSASLGFIVGLIVVLSGLYLTTVRYLADARYAHARALSSNEEVMNALVRAMNLNSTNDEYLRSASQTALALLRTEAAKRDADANRAQRVQNLISSSIQLAQRAATVQPLESMNWSNLGDVYQSLTGLVENVEQLAEDAFRKAGELRPGDPLFDNRVGQMWLTRADLVRSLANQSNAPTASRLEKEWDASLANAESAFKRAIEKSGSYGLAIYNLGAVYDRQGKVNEAIAQLEKIVPYNPNESTLIFELGLLYIRAGQKDDAYIAMQRAVLVAPNFANARWYYALLLEDRGAIDDALAQLREIQKANPDNEVLATKIAQLETGQRAIPPGKVIDTQPLR
ncbi:MAG: tetratricopeptide repeat protein [Candidatus Yanofskybacteria bacterium]|nr:tetratricopeptide repeat protein [Candidatus Yanofskybacteria bacterium]